MTKAGKKADVRAAGSRKAFDEGVAVSSRTKTEEEPPPFGASWKTLYAAVLLNLALLVALFYLFTRAFG